MITYARAIALTLAGFTISTFSQVLGGIDILLQTLIMFMAIDFASGWLCAAVFKCSNKTSTGRLSSTAGFKGLVKKVAGLMIVIVAVYLDALLGTNNLTRNAAIAALSLNELLSIMENMGQMGIKMPEPIVNAIEMLGKR